MRSILIAVCCLLLAALPVFAQSDRGNITGTIGDPAGAVIAGAKIEAKNNQTGAQYQMASTGTGNYTLAQLPSGVYQLSVSVPGFKQYVRTGITVMVAQTLRIDITLEVGNITEVITVSADAPLLRTESGELSHNVSFERLSDLPILGFDTTIRNPYSATALIPGTLYDDRTYVRVNGAPANSQSLRVEGQDATGGFRQSQTALSQPSAEAVEEFAVQTSNYSAEYGQAGGGFFNVTMKSGTNKFHASAYDYFSNEALNASQPYVNVKPRSRKNDYGFTLGGPVWIPKMYDGHDKTFFFVSMEWFRQTTIYNNIPQLVPTLAYREGDFRQAMTTKVLNKDPLGRNIIEGTIYDPTTERIVNGLRVRDPFSDNTIPKNRFDPVAVKIQEMIPQPTNAGLTNNYLHPWKSPNERDIPAFKVDHNLSARSKLSFYWSSVSNDALHATGPAAGDGLPSPISAEISTHVLTYTARLNFDQTLTPTTILHLGVGFMGNNWNDLAENTKFDQLKELGLPKTTVTIFPYITGLNVARGGMKNMGPNTQYDMHMAKPTANASLTWAKNNHTYKFGAEMRVEGYPTALYDGGRGSYAFSVEQTGLPSTLGQNLQGGTVGFPYASFLLGLVSSGNIGFVNNTRLGKSAWGFFAQDTWKVTRRFTLDYGLRWDYQTYMQEQYGRVANFSPTTPNPSTGNLLGAVIFEGGGPGRCNCDFARVYPYAFGPRLGAAYQITPKTVLRAGLGISYGQTASENHVSMNMGSRNPFSSPSYGDPAIIWRNGPPTPVAWPNFDPGQYPTPGTLTAPYVAIDHNAGRPPRMVQWSISVQHEIFKNLAIEAAYVGNRGAWWQANALINVNALTPERIASFGLDVNNAADQTLLNSQLNSTTAISRGFNKPPYANFPMTSTVAQALRPFPQFSATVATNPAINYLWAPLGRTWYDSLQLKMTKRFSHGLDFTSAFTWQKELTMGAEDSDTQNITATVNNVFNRPMNKYISGLSRPFVFVTAVNYKLPALGWNKALSWVIRDWTLGAVLQYVSGLPIRSPIAQNRLNTVLFQNTFANRVPGEPLFTKDFNCNSCFDPNKDFLLNKDAWVDPPAGQFGVSAGYYNDYRSRRRPSESMSLGRIFRIKEQVTLSIRADFQNIFNRTQPSNPTSTNAKLTQTTNPTTGQTVSGFGYINTGSVASPPRQGMIVARIQF